MTTIAVKSKKDLDGVDGDVSNGCPVVPGAERAG
jgi:hypothetical protein